MPPKLTEIYDFLPDTLEKYSYRSVYPSNPAAGEGYYPYLCDPVLPWW